VTVETDPRIRAALLWDRPTLVGLDDLGVRQWRAAMNLSFLDLGDLDETDVLSVAAHTIRWAVDGVDQRTEELRATLRSSGPVGELFERLIGLVFDLDDAAADHEALRSLLAIAEQIADKNLRARILLRLTVFASQRRRRDIAAQAAARTVDASNEKTRLGAVARRWATELGVGPQGFDPWAPTKTPSDPLLSLPWVLTEVTEGAAKTAARRFERRLAGVWDTSFQIGRTVRDDLVAAMVQAEWCGATNLQSSARRLIATDIFSDETARTDEVQWALRLWASEPNARRIVSAVRAAEPQLDALAAEELLRAVRDDPQTSDEVVVEVAAGLWDLVSDAGADVLLDWLLSAEVERTEQTRGGLLGALLWRRSETWARAFAAASSARRVAMFAAIDPAHLDVLPETLTRALADHAATARTFSAGHAAMQVTMTSTPLRDVNGLSIPDIVELLDWNARSVTPEAIASEVDKLIKTVRRRLMAAAEGTVDLAAYEVGQYLGRLASYLPHREPSAVEALSVTVRDSTSSANWQFGALEGLAALARAGHLDNADRAAIRDLKIIPGPRLFGERVSADTLHAAQLRIVGPSMSDRDVEWLAVAGRGGDVQARLVTMAALDAEGLPFEAAVDWSLVGGLFDPDHAVTIQAVASIGRRGVTPRSGAFGVVRERLGDLFDRGPRDVRREVVVTAATRPELDARDIVARARDDRSWIVRREVPPAGESGEAPD
jgi:hypothetical protein